ncbi:CzcE family metal-binding protein [Telluria mixta]|uniref:CzcE family metal-binding protein n=1 Tax=Telluria mixta TaxID=34071 RepID=A0ABT2BSV2_9BURK|nr:CzcE family metal-binding protein [Telluria mixta]MCS0628195.1 CzcE family metal-binding protein [Telluria mixta]WEM93691.1 CzcE family metal-binding protein [Telluria mixta]
MTKTTILAAAPLLALALSIPAHAADSYGTVAPATSTAGRVIDVTPTTRYVNVANGETVTIRLGGDTFTWTVATRSNVDAVPLARVAPEGSPATSAVVYVGQSASYHNS